MLCVGVVRRCVRKRASTRCKRASRSGMRAYVTRPKPQVVDEPLKTSTVLPLHRSFANGSKARVWRRPLFY